jgi:serine/threonine-protein kinase
MSDHPTRTVPPDGTANETRAFDEPDATAPALASSSERYDLHTPIARGGMGEVFAARDVALNREVAVKVLRADLRDRPAIAARFIEEARITGQLQHPNIPPIHDLGTLADGRPFIAMKLIKGRTLADLLARDRPDVPALLAIFEQVCQAVAFAHERAVIHRDLKPGNVMVGRFNEVQVMDWGLAKVMNEGGAPSTERPAPVEPVVPVSVIQTDRDGSSLTQAGSLLGTPAYMPPEQARGDVDRTDARSDVFALGAVLCELLTGAPPYSAPSSAEVQALALTAQLAPALARLSACGADAELVALAKRCLAPKPDERPANAGEVARAMTAYREGVAERLRASELGRARAEEKRKRARVQLALAGAVGLLLAAGGAFAWYSDRQAEQRKAEREKEEELQRAEREGAEVRLRDTVTTALNEAEAALRADDMPAADTALARAKERLGAGGPDDLRARFAELSKDREMVERQEFLLDEQRTGLRATFAAPSNYRTAYPDLFRAHGLDLVAGDPAELAARVNRSPIRAQLLSGLYVVLERSIQFGAPAPLCDLLRRVDDDPVRNAIRDAAVAHNTTRLRELVKQLEPVHLTPHFAFFVSMQSISRAERLRVLTTAWERYPGSFLLNDVLCEYYLFSVGPREKITPEDAAAAVAYARIQVALRPASPFAYEYLALSLGRAKRYDEAIAAFKRYAALRANPVGTNPRFEIGQLIEERSGRDAALEYYRAELAAAPNDAGALAALGRAHLLDRRYDDAFPLLLRAWERNRANSNVAYSVLECFRQKGDWDGALKFWREARNGSRGPFPDVTFADLLIQNRRYSEALQVCERMTVEFPEVPRGVGPWRQTTALAALCAATDEGIDPPARAERPALRRRAIDLLRNELAVLRSEFSLDRNRAVPLRRVNRLLTERRFHVVRDLLSLAALPPDEAKEWLEFWSNVCKFRDEIEIPVAPPPREINHS